ncbi:family 43 glycosylhydrolase [Hyalangium rubrum]|uniref:Family 43 glycosylhydrolase n=1 Tax=Hyalangium rubrum TaxID=3103134 RepID=A0ABU5HG23_9BACT|nr:family 43 glycosylhydrolase [Hyalangium sp. s54d21]MDY7231010.1 family 43 glycosylhydrolase [Hyalangium sp. s54d21]
MHSPILAVLRFPLLTALLLLASVASAQTFYNPIVAAGQDPSIVQYNGYYYLVQSINSDTAIAITKSRTLTGLASGNRVTVWTRPSNTGALCCGVWAPELLFLNGRFYIYFAADDGNNDNHRMYVLESTGTDPQGSYTLKGKISAPTDRWAIDGTVLQVGASLYFLWSGWDGFTNIQQNLYIAPMSNPYTISGERVLISSPLGTWERLGGPPYINEGPQVLQRNGKIFIIYSASGSWTDDYCLGMLAASSTANLLQQSSWAKSNGCVFSKTATAYGPGHNTFVTSPDGTQDWLVYHANQTSGSGWGGRSLRAQRFTWNADGSPNFGTPATTSTALALPSGEKLGASRYEAELAVINHATARTAVGGASNGQVVGYIDYADSWVEFRNVWAPSAGAYALTVRFANGMGAPSTHNVSVNGAAATAITYPHTGWDVWTSATTFVTLKAGDNTIRFSKGTSYAELDYVELNRYEAENATLNRASVRFAVGGASSERVVGGIDFSDSWVEFRNVTVPSAGAYQLRVRFANGSTATSSHYVSVNGGASTALSYAKTGWDNWTLATIAVNLNAGSNTIRLTKGVNYAELDCIEIHK